MIVAMPPRRPRARTWPIVAALAVALVALVATATAVGMLYLASTAAHRQPDPAVICTVPARP